MSNKGDIDEELNELPFDGVNDRESRLDLGITENTVVQKPEIKSIKPEVVTEVSSQPCKKETYESSIAKVYDATQKLKLLLDSVDGSAKSCLAKFMPGLDKYEEA